MAAPKIQTAVQIAAEFGQDLQRLDRAAVETMLQIWGDVADPLQEQMFQLAEQIAAQGSTPTRAQLLRVERYQALLQSVQVQVQQLEFAATGVLADGTSQAALLGIQQGTSTLESLGIAGNFNRLPVSAVQNITSLARAGQPLASLLAPMYGQAAGGITRELINGVAMGLSPRRIARRMIQDGLTDSLNHLLLVTRDQYNRAHRTASLETYRKSDVVSGYVRRCARQPGRTCIACVALDGIIYKLQEDFEGHPQDRCTLIPIVRGMDPKSLSDGRTWFKSLTPEEQIATMGQARWEAWQAGELRWRHMIQRKTHPIWGTSVTPKPMGRTKIGKRTRKPKVKQEVPKPEELPEPIVPDVEEDGFPADLAGLETVHGLGGSTGATLVRDPKTGRQYVMKKGASADHIRQEFAADEVYRAMDIRVPKAKLYETSKGPVKLAEFVEGEPLGVLRRENRLPVGTIKELQEGFAADALLGNWDVVGLNYDNILIDHQGHPWRIDNGSCFNFRAPGGKKNYDEWPLEMWTFRDSRMNRSSADIFGKMAYEDVVDSIGFSLSRSDDFMNAVPERLRKTVEGRIANMREAARQHEELSGDLWRSSYIDGFTRAHMEMNRTGLFNRFPQRLRKKGTTGIYVDENLDPWDHLRGDRNTTDDLFAYVKGFGGDPRMLSEYWAAQSGSSWSRQAIDLKQFINQNMDLDPQKIYWGDKFIEPRTFSEMETRTWQSSHAFNYEFLRRTDFRANNREKGYVRIVRTEDSGVLNHYNIKPQERDRWMPRGLAESGSHHSAIFVGGSRITVQNVPRSRIMANYMFAGKPGGQDTSLHSDHENEFVFVPYGIHFDLMWEDELKKLLRGNA